ncbi:hypothetical protein F1640_19030 [Novosphingobium sp. NBM11]|uniref:hypothetical protein n=1 Tax=Novosphingobium sp. NBM11 TaxID=2596914 RepID=UPI00189252B2|nr:hypothetical protein [Novosphingobium sp. NBM11]MBF5092048.1 hypothetical protein [Novosphingobium sp. NBM11]
MFTLVKRCSSRCDSSESPRAASLNRAASRLLKRRTSSSATRHNSTGIDHVEIDWTQTFRADVARSTSRLANTKRTVQAAIARAASVGARRPENRERVASSNHSPSSVSNIGKSLIGSVSSSGSV